MTGLLRIGGFMGSGRGSGEGRLPAITLNGLTGSVPGGMTFTRSSPATWTDSDLLQKTAAANAIRYDHDPVTGAARGIRLDPVATNLVLQSNALSSASWVRSRTTVTANNAASADGATTGDTIVSSASGSNTYYVSQAVAWLGTTTYTVSYYISKSAPRAPGINIFGGFQASTVAARFDPVTGASAVTSGSGTARMESAPNNMWRCSFTTTSQASPTASNVGFLISTAYTPATADCTFTGTGAETNPISGVMVEIGSAPTSYIDTTTATVSRGLETLAMPLTSAPGFVGAAFSASVEFELQSLQASQTLLSVDGNNASDMIAIAMAASPTTTLNLVVNAAGSSVVAAALATGLAAGTFARAAIAVSNGVIRSSVNGGAIVSTPVASMPGSLTHLRLGQRGGATNALHGWIRKSSLFRHVLSDAELVTASTVGA